MLAGGADIAVVSKLLGHSSISITSDVYPRLIGSIGQQAVNGAAALIAHAADSNFVRANHKGDGTDSTLRLWRPSAQVPADRLHRSHRSVAHAAHNQVAPYEPDRQLPQQLGLLVGACP
jgi:hypothetical protein